MKMMSYRLSMLFVHILEYIVTVDFKVCVITPAIKDKRKDNKDVNNYGPVRIMSVLVNYLKCVCV